MKKLFTAVAIGELQIPFLVLAFFFALTGQVHAVDSAPVASLQNPLASGTIQGFIADILKVVVIVSLPIISLFFVVVGYKFISAQGNSSKLEEAKMNFLYAVLGAFLIMGAWIIATMIAGTVTQLVGP